MNHELVKRSWEIVKDGIAYFIVGAIAAAFIGGIGLLLIIDSEVRIILGMMSGIAAVLWLIVWACMRVTEKRDRRGE
jgi:hypothetical protein